MCYCGKGYLKGADAIKLMNAPSATLHRHGHAQRWYRHAKPTLAGHPP